MTADADWFSRIGRMTLVKVEFAGRGGSFEDIDIIR
jgi:hypothetical protein